MNFEQAVEHVQELVLEVDQQLEVDLIHSVVWFIQSGYRRTLYRQRSSL